MQSQMFFLLLIIISGSLAGHDYRLVGLFEEDNYPVSEICTLGEGKFK